MRYNNKIDTKTSMFRKLKIKIKKNKNQNSGIMRVLNR